MAPLTPDATSTPLAPPPSPSELRRSTRRKRSQKEASIEDQPSERGSPFPARAVTTPNPHALAERAKKRRTEAPASLDAPDTSQTSFSLNLPPQPAPYSPLVEESFRPQQTPPPLASTPTPRFPTNPDASMSDPDPSISLDPSFRNRTTSSLKDRIIAAKERGPKINTNTTTLSRDPIDKYSSGKLPDGTLPNVYYSHPTAALDAIDINQVGDWEALPDGKLLAHPFGHEVRTMDHHPKITSNIFAAVVEITQSNTVGICAPRPCPISKGTPSVFLIYNLSALHRQILLKREIWSSTTATFRVTTLDPVCPDYLFGINRLTTKSAEEVENAVRKVWDAPETTNFLNTLSESLPVDERDCLSRFSMSMRVAKMDMKREQGLAAPTFNVFADGQLINDDGLWCSLRNFLASQPYALQFQNPGVAGTDLHRCSICHSIEHPRGLCTYPKISDWNGPEWDHPEANSVDQRRLRQPIRSWKRKGPSY